MNELNLFGRIMTQEAANAVGLPVGTTLAKYNASGGGRSGGGGNNQKKIIDSDGMEDIALAGASINNMLSKLGFRGDKFTNAAYQMAEEAYKRGR